jgi:magnesium transporter
VLEGATVEEAIDIVRTIAQEVPNIPNLFVVDHHFHLLGVLPLAKLILAREGQKVDAIMDRGVVSVTVDTDQEEVARLFKRHDLLSLPVTDARGALLGRITIDDVVDVLEEEANEDFSKLSGLGQEEPIFDTPLRAIRRRLPWLALNLVTTSLGAFVIGRFENTIQTVAIAAALMTIVAAQGGNAGVQTLTVIVRGLALGKVGALHARRLVIKELSVGLGNGLVLGVLAATLTYLWRGELLVSAVLGVALCVNFVMAALAGSLIPLTLRRAGVDPAVGSSVILTACTDMCGFFSFLGILTAGLAYLS